MASLGGQGDYVACRHAGETLRHGPRDLLSISTSPEMPRLRRLRDHRAPALSEEFALARYFMNLRDGTEELLDPDGVEFATLDLMRASVMNTARDLICGDIMRGVLDLRFRIDAENGAGKIIYTLPFKHALSIIPENAG